MLSLVPCLVVVFIIVIVIYYALKTNTPPVSGYPPLPPPMYYSYDTSYTEKLRKKVLAFPKALYGTLIIVGFITLFLGIILGDVSNNVSGVIIGAVESFVGILLIFFSFKMYKNKMKRMSEEMLPEILASKKP